MKKAILIVSFGTTYTETRKKNITAIKEQALEYQSLYRNSRGEKDNF